MFFSRKPLSIPGPGEALEGRREPIATAERHFVNGQPLKGPYSKDAQKALFGMGCFWGTEKVFWSCRASI